MVAMKPGSAGMTQRSVITTFLHTLLFNTIIAIFLTVIQIGKGFVINLVFSQCIGLSICSCILLSHLLFQPGRPAVQAFLVATALLTGSIVGSLIGSVLAGLNPSTLFGIDGLFVKLLLLGVVFGSIISYFFSSRERIAASQAEAQAEKIKRLTSEKKVIEANLKLLRAQIEPHFLFNTLSNVVSLLDTDPARGKSMLEDFIRYLRASLPKSRAGKVTLAEEMEMIQAYLGLFKVRMGARLSYAIDLPENLKSVSFPPMLLQPLVENAIKHGLESKVDGGEILIRASENDGLLRLEVVDTGLGFSAESDSGMGLSNIRERLSSLYGDRGRLILEENTPRGLKATIEVPHGES